MRGQLRDSLRHLTSRLVGSLQRWARNNTRPYPALVLGALADRFASPDELAAENRLLRQQLILLRRQIVRPQLRSADRVRLVLLASRTKTWASAMLIVKPETVLRWHRTGFRLLWKRKSRSKNRKPRISGEIIALIQQMALNNRLWGAERIRGELLKLGIQHAKSTIQRYIRAARPSGREGQTWSAFMRNHTHHLWACDFLQSYDVFFRPIFAFLILEIGSRRIVHVAATRSPTSEWTAQQLREATPWGGGPRFLIRDRDCKYGEEFDRAASATGIHVLRTPYRAPNANAHCERMIGSVRRECLDHVLILSERQFFSVLSEYRDYHNRVRPHQGIGQRVPAPEPHPLNSSGPVIEIPHFGGLHHEYRLAA